MNRSALLLSIALGALALGACSDEPVSPLPSPTVSLARNAEDAPGRSLVVFDSPSSVPQSFADDVERLGGTVEGTMEQVGAAVVTNLRASAAAKLARASGVRSVDLDDVIPMRHTRNTEVSAVLNADGETLDLSPASPAAPHTAGLYATQWNMHVIQAQPAWQAGFIGSPGVSIAILDTGIDEGHPTIPALRNLDLLGRVDRVRSRSFMPAEDAVVQQLFPGAPLYTDLDGHGTNVASQASSNAINFAGVTSQTRLIAVKVCTILPPPPTPANPNPVPGYCSTAAVFAGLAYAVDQGADVINLSLGGGFLKKDCQGCTSLINRVIHYAHSRGVTVVVAAGNSATDLDHDKNSYNTYCSAPNVICVAATGPFSAGPALTGPFDSPDAPAVYSEYGRSAIDVAAPGGKYRIGIVNGQPAITSAAYVLALCPRLTAAVFNEATNTVVRVGPCGVWGYIGTSQASPHVAGLAALLAEQLGRNPGAIRSTIRSTADDLGQSGTDPRYGKGRINVARALGVI